MSLRVSSGFVEAVACAAVVSIAGCGGGSSAPADGGAHPVSDAVADAGHDGAPAKHDGAAHDSAVDGVSHADAGHADASDRDGGEPPGDGAVDSGAPMDGGTDVASAVDAMPDAPALDAGTPALRYVGRVDMGAAGGPTYEWSGTQVIARFSGPEVDLQMNDVGNLFDVVVDGVVQPSAVVGAADQTTYALASGLAAGTHVVSLYRRTEADMGPTQILGVTVPGGALLPPEAPMARRIAVIGDSISCGYGDLGAGPSCDGTGANEEHYLSYGAVAARALGADLTTTAWSGLGLYENYDGTTTATMPDLYPFTLPTLYGATPPADALWTFSQWAPDAVVIDLGTNDFQGGNRDPGSAYTTTLESFLATIRASYPSAYILCATGPMVPEPYHSTWVGYVETAVGVRAAMGDTHVGTVDFGVQPIDADCDGLGGTVTCGCDYHPTVATQASMAAQVVTALHGALGW